MPSKAPLGFQSRVIIERIKQSPRYVHNAPNAHGFLSNSNFHPASNVILESSIKEYINTYTQRRVKQR